MSLYDYLGRPAGSNLGEQVFRAASVSRIPVKTKEVTTPAYKGKIMMYPENWLIGYFSTGQSNFGVHEIEISLNDMLDKIYG